jgi:hypothetical protein
VTPLTRAKLGLAVAGLLCFAFGMRTNDARLRWVGVGLVAVAWLLRFVRRPSGS